MNYEEVLQFLYSSLPMYQRVGNTAIRKDLTNTLALCQHLENPHLKFPSVHIGGTNGKGSSAHSIAAVLQSAGYKTGLYTSPHLKDFTERIKINGEPIHREAVVRFVEENRDRLLQISPSFFETTVVMAFDYFAREKVDIAVVEVGLGGRLDSTNVIYPLVSLITNIGYDHTEMLGETLPQIAFEKAGIIKEGTPVVISERQQETSGVYRELAEKRQAPLYFAQDYYRVELQGRGEGKLWVEVYREEELLYSRLPLSLTGNYQQKNLPGILKTIEVLQEQGFQISDKQLQQALASVHTLTGLKGRWQQLSVNPLTICDTGHNQEAFQDIVLHLQALEHEQLHMVLGFSADKDVEKVLKLLPAEACYYFCQAQVPRAMDAARLKQQAQRQQLAGTAYATVKEALESARKQAGINDIIFIGGSTFVVAELEEL